MPVAVISSGTVVPSSGASDRAAHKIASGSSFVSPRLASGSDDVPCVTFSSPVAVAAGSSAVLVLDRLPRYLVERRPEVGV